MISALSAPVIQFKKLYFLSLNVLGIFPTYSFFIKASNLFHTEEYLIIWVTLKIIVVFMEVFWISEDFEYARFLHM